MSWVPRGLQGWVLVLRSGSWWVRRAAEAARAGVQSCAPPGTARCSGAAGGETQVMEIIKLCPDSMVTSGHHWLPETPSTVVLLLRNTLNQAQGELVIV